MELFNWWRFHKAADENYGESASGYPYFPFVIEKQTLASDCYLSFGV